MSVRIKNGIERSYVDPHLDNTDWNAHGDAATGGGPYSIDGDLSLSGASKIDFNTDTATIQTDVTNDASAVAFDFIQDTRLNNAGATLFRYRTLTGAGEKTHVEFKPWEAGITAGNYKTGQLTLNRNAGLNDVEFTGVGLGGYYFSSSSGGTLGILPSSGGFSSDAGSVAFYLGTPFAYDQVIQFDINALYPFGDSVTGLILPTLGRHVGSTPSFYKFIGLLLNDGAHVHIGDDNDFGINHNENEAIISTNYQNNDNMILVGNTKVYSEDSTGSEEVTNGTFNTDISGWSGTGWTWDSGNARAEYTGTGTDAFTQTISGLTVGNLYKLSYDFIKFGGPAQNLVVTIADASFSKATDTATYVEYFVATSNKVLSFSGDKDGNGTGDAAIDNVSIVEVTGGNLDVIKNLTAETAQIGDASNYTDIKSDGEINLVGNARVNTHQVIPHTQLATSSSGGTAPDQVFLGAYTGYSYDIGDSSAMNIELPHDHDTSEDIEVHISWAINEAYATNSGEIQWQLDWAAVPYDGSEALDAPTHSGTDTSGDINIPATAKGLIHTTNLTIPNGSIDALDTLGIEITRIAIGDGNNPTADPVIIEIHLEYVKNKLGTAL